MYLCICWPCLPAAAQGHARGPAAVARQGPHTPALHNHGDTTSVRGVVSESRHAQIHTSSGAQLPAMHSAGLLTWSFRHAPDWLQKLRRAAPAPVGCPHTCWQLHGALTVLTCVVVCWHVSCCPAGCSGVWMQELPASASSSTPTSTQSACSVLSSEWHAACGHAVN